MKKESLLLIISFLIGIGFRLWFIRLSPQPFIFDQTEYHRFALQILQNGVTMDSARAYGYPLFLACIYKLFGMGNIQAVYIFQAILDSLTAILIFTWARVLFTKKSVSWIACLLYLFNPYTSAYVGVVLSEISGIFFMTLLLYLFTVFWKQKITIAFFIFSFIVGFLPQIRPVFLYFTIILLLLGIYKYWKNAKQKKNLKMIAINTGIALFILPFLYVLIGNILDFNEWKITNVDHMLPRQLFMSVKMPDRGPYHIKNGYDVLPIEVMQLFKEYHVTPKNQKDRVEMGNKYLIPSIEIIKKEPWLFVHQCINKMFFVWEKRYIFYYWEIPNMFKDIMVYWGNITLLILGFTGLIKWLINNMRNKKDLLLSGVYIFLLVYISVSHSIGVPEDRYSLPGYPIIFLFAAYMLVFLWGKIKKPLTSKTKSYKTNV